MNKLGWKGRTGVVLSAVWILLLYALAPSEDTTKAIAGFGLVPIGVVWGAIWAVQAYRQQAGRANDSLAREDGKGMLLRFALGVIVLAGSLWYAQSLMGPAVYQEAGYWTAFSLVCWAVLRSIPRISHRAVLLTVTAYATTMCVQAYRAHLETQEIKQEIAAAAPFLLRVNAGELIADEEIRRAPLGRWEPFIRASAKSAQEQVGLVAAYSKEIGALELEKLLDARVVGSSPGRQVVRERLQRYEIALNRLQQGLDANWQRLSDQASVLSAQMPSGSGAGLKEGLTERHERVAPLIGGWISSQRKLIAHTRDVSAFLEGLGPTVSVVESPPNLLFSDESDLAQYRTLMARFTVLAAEEADWQKRLLADERESAQKLVEFIQAPAR